MQALQIGQDDTGSIEMIDGYIEESLNLVGMQVHRDDTVHTCHTEQVGNELGSDGYTWLVLAVLTSPSEIGDDSIDGAGRGSLGCVDHEQQLHQIVRVGEGALHEEDVASTNTLLIRNSELAVRKLRDLKLTKRTT